MSSMGRTASGERLWGKARNVVSALGAFKRSYSKVDLDNGAPTSKTARGMTEVPPPRKSSKKGCIALTAGIVFVLVAVIISTVVGVTVSKKHSSDGDGDLNANSVAGVCSKTLYPEVCNNTLFGSDTSNPQKYVQIAMKAAMGAISKSLEAVQDLQLSAPVKNGTQYSTLVMCGEVFSECLEQVNTSLFRVSDLKLESLKSEVGDIQQYMAAALTYQDTCLTGVQDFGIWNASDAINGTHGAYTTMLLSNSLSMVNSLSRVTDFGRLMPRHSRRLLGSSDLSGSSLRGEFPQWISREGRRLLQTSKPVPNAIVAKDGSGQFTSIQKAVDAAPSSGARWVIYVKKGTYNEYVNVPKGKKNLMVYGDGPGNTVITGKKSVVGSGTTTFLSATFAVVAPGFIAKDMTIQNTAGPSGEQAVALRAGGDQQAFSNVNLEGYQDTLYAHTFRQFYSACTITGTIDYIFGNAAAVFQNCNLQARQGRSGSQNIYTASGRTDPGQNTGFSFLSCTVGAAPGLESSFPTYLGRPWKPYAQTLFIKSTLASCVNPAGWLLWNGDQNSGMHVNYGEYGNTGPGASTASRVKWSKQISITEATKFTVSNFIAGQEWLPATSIAFNNAL
ncbi:hypothetical protein M758_2G084600 [Ceratodon purpureus]|nr:hypothetical protein M758_2G084600 [Ceratodon purpureus]KAG0625854.1 hypothetical protein M758_2G084600 [Ceratodon purpureus]